MKLEIEVSEDQLKNLDEDLSTLLSTLSTDDKLKLIEAYLFKKFDEGLYATNFYGSSELTTFGRKLVDGVDKYIGEHIVNEIIDTEGYKNIFDNIMNNMQKIISESISKYVIEHLFMDKGCVQSMINHQIYDIVPQQFRR